MYKKLVVITLSLIGFVGLTFPVSAGIKLPAEFTKTGSDTTNLSKFTDEQLMSVKNLVLEVPEFGKITFLKPVNLSAPSVKTMMASLDDYLVLGRSSVKLDTTKLPQLSKPVLIEFYGVELLDDEELQVIENGVRSTDQDSFNLEYSEETDSAKFTVMKLGDYKLEAVTDEQGIKTQNVQFLTLESNFAPVMISILGITFIVLGLLVWLNTNRRASDSFTKNSINNPGVTAGVTAVVTGMFVMATFAATPLFSVQQTTSTRDVSVASDEILGNNGGTNAAYCTQPETSRCQVRNGRFTGYRCVSVLVPTNSCSSGWALNCTQVDSSCSRYNQTRPTVRVTPAGFTRAVRDAYTLFKTEAPRR